MKFEELKEQFLKHAAECDTTQAIRLARYKEQHGKDDPEPYFNLPHALALICEQIEHLNNR